MRDKIQISAATFLAKPKQIYLDTTQNINKEKNEILPQLFNTDSQKSMLLFFVFCNCAGYLKSCTPGDCFWDSVYWLVASPNS